MHILYACQDFDHLSGSPLYVYECAREMRKLGHQVTIVSNHGGGIARRARSLGIRLAGWDELPIAGVDVLHVQQPEPSRRAIAAHPGFPAVATIHSELVYEEPYQHPAIRTYVCIRPSIQAHVVARGIPVDRTRVVYNPVDAGRFHPVPMPLGRRRKVLFVGTIDTLRRAAILDLRARSAAEGFDLRIVGLQREGYLRSVAPGNTTVGAPRWDVEREIAQCHETAGILLGRTTIEGWMCGRPGWIYDVDATGAIRSVALHPVPPDVGKFDSARVASELEQIYVAASTPSSASAS